MWRQHVSFPDRFSTDVCAFLDLHANKGKLSKVGTYNIKEPINELVPYELLPLRVKKVVNLLPLCRTKFKNLAAYKVALFNLHVYGYLPDVDQGLIEKQRYWNTFRRKWQIDNPESMRNSASKQQDGQAIWRKGQQDVNLYQSMIH
jgi:hypothetical protein